MPHIIADRVQETSTTTGTGTYTLAGAAIGFRPFGSVCSDNDTVFYAAAGGGDWEVGIGTYSTGTLARTTILSSSNASAAVDWPAGTRDVFLTVAAQQIAMLGTPDFLIATQGVI